MRMDRLRIDFVIPVSLEYTTQPTRGLMKNFRKWFGIAWLLIAIGPSFGAAPADLRLLEAVKKADAAAVRALIAARVDINAADVDGSTALHWAAQRENPE